MSDGATEMSYDSRLVTYESKCPLCESPETREFCVGHTQGHVYYVPWLDTLHWHLCRNCSHVFRRERLTELGEIELSISKTGKEKFHLDNQDTLRNEWGHVISWLLSICKGLPAEVFDIGFGDGAFLVAAQEFGLKFQGIDTQPEVIKHFQTLVPVNVKDCVKLGSYKDLKEVSRWPFVSICDIIEHTTDPKDLLSTCHRILQPGGLLLVSTPSVTSLPWVLMDIQHDNPYWVEIEHQHCFSSARLLMLLDEMGFSPISMRLNKRYKCGLDVLAWRKQDESPSGSSPKL